MGDEFTYGIGCLQMLSQDEVENGLGPWRCSSSFKDIDVFRNLGNCLVFKFDRKMKVGDSQLYTSVRRFTICPSPSQYADPASTAKWEGDIANHLGDFGVTARDVGS